MPVDRQRFGILRRQDTHLAVFAEGVAEVDRAAVDHPGIRALREARRYRRGDFADGCAARHRLRGAVRERDSNVGTSGSWI
jgi:hypothetical protein